MMPFNGKCQNLQTSFFTFLIFAKTNDLCERLSQTHTHKTETDKNMAIGEIFQICLINHIIIIHRSIMIMQLYPFAHYIKELL